jgi:hypothetical protein
MTEILLKVAFNNSLPAMSVKRTTPKACNCLAGLSTSVNKCYIGTITD